MAILDERAGIGGKYHDAALAALPSCPTTSKIEDVQQFIREQKRPDYFCEKGFKMNYRQDHRRGFMCGVHRSTQLPHLTVCMT